MAKSPKRIVHRSAGVRGTNVAGTQERGILLHDFKRGLKTAPQVIPEPLDADVIVGVYGELFWYWPIYKRDSDRMLLHKLSVEDLAAVPDDIETELHACVERYLKGFRDREPSEPKVREAYDEWRRGSLTTAQVIDVLDYIIDTHQIEE